MTVWPSGTLMDRLAVDVGAELLALAPARMRRPGDVLIHQGVPDGRHVFLLRAPADGRTALVKVTATMESGDDVLLGIRVSGDMVGELALLRGTPRSATVMLCSEALVHAIPPGVFSEFVKRRPAVWAAVAQMIADRLDWANRRRLDMATLSVTGRVAQVLTDLVDRHGFEAPGGFDVGVSLTQAELGRLVGAREDAVNKAMRLLRAKGLADTRYRRVTVHDLQGLRDFSLIS
ncbi:Crp/Fnr family transcriptional regulator [Nonomuraea sp. NPDC004354]